ncbi:MAG: dihydroorotate dehydrogenase [Clostridiaceae bacterium]
MEFKINDLVFKNPVIAASGTFGFGEEYSEFYDLSLLGGISSKGLTLNAKQGNDGVRICETRSGMINSVGLQNPGVDYFIEKELPRMKKYNTNILANLGGGSIEDYEKGIEKLDSTHVDAIELNISCPNVKHGGMAFGIKSKDAYDIVKRVRKICTKPLIVKLSPNAEDIVDMAYNCCLAGADSISLVNTFKAMAVDIEKKQPVFDNVTAGLSGPCIKPIALRMVYEVAKVVDVPIIGMGGISNWRDAIEFIMVGASGIQVGTANFIDPYTSIKILQGIEKYMKENKIETLDEIRKII